MKKIYKLKQWYTLEDAAQRLSLTLGEEVSVRDLLQMAIEGQIALSWFLIEAYVQKKGDGSVQKISGPFVIDFKMNQNIFCDLRSNISGLTVDFIPNQDGITLRDSDNAVWRIMRQFTLEDCEYFVPARHAKEVYDQIKEEGPFFRPSDVFPAISELGFQADDLSDFESRLLEQEKKQEDHPRVVNGLLKILLAVAVKKYQFRPGSRGSAARNLANTVQETGLSVDEDTIRSYLSLAVEAHWDSKIHAADHPNSV